MEDYRVCPYILPTASWCICWTAQSNWQNPTPSCLTCGRCAHHTCARWFRRYFHNKYCHPNGRVYQLQCISCLAFQACMPSSNHKVQHQLSGNRIVSYIQIFDLLAKVVIIQHITNVFAIFFWKIIIYTFSIIQIILS